MLLLYTKRKQKTKYIYIPYGYHTITYDTIYDTIQKETYKRRLHGQMINDEINVHYISILRLYNKIKIKEKHVKNRKKTHTHKRKRKILKHSHIYSYIVKRYTDTYVHIQKKNGKLEKRKEPTEMHKKIYLSAVQMQVKHTMKKLTNKRETQKTWQIFCITIELHELFPYFR